MTERTDMNEVKLIVAGGTVDDVGESTPEAEGGRGFHEDAFFGRRHNDEKTVNLSTMAADYTKIRSQVTQIFLMQEATSTESGFRLDELTVHLGVSAKGGIGFIAELGVEASVELKFVRH